MGNGGYPATDLRLRQNSKFNIFEIFFLEMFVLRSNLFQVASFPSANLFHLQVDLLLQS